MITRARATGSSHRARCAASRSDDQTGRHGHQHRRLASRRPARARRRPARSASCSRPGGRSSPPSSTGGAGVARAERRSTAKGRWADQRIEARHDLDGHHHAGGSSAASSAAVGSPARRRASAERDRRGHQQELRQHQRPSREDRARRDRQALAPQGAATVQAPGVDAEQQRATRGHQARAGSSSCSTAGCRAIATSPGRDAEHRQAATHRHRPPDRRPVGAHQCRQVRARHRPRRTMAALRARPRRAAARRAARWAGTAPSTTAPSSSHEQDRDRRRPAPGRACDAVATNDPDGWGSGRARCVSSARQLQRRARPSEHRPASARTAHDAVRPTPDAPRPSRRRPARSRSQRRARAG